MDNQKYVLYFTDFKGEEMSKKKEKEETEVKLLYDLYSKLDKEVYICTQDPS